MLTVYQGGSTSALASTFQDIGLVLPASNPLVADASGRIPMFFVADGSYGLRLTDQFGTQTNGGFFYPQVPSIGASSSGGGGTPVDPTTVASTGDLKWRLENSTIPGWVRLNGRTIGNASSGASERANADTQALFIYIWSTFSSTSGNTVCPVVGGIGASALADFNANKQITLQDARARSLFGLDDMGNAALGGFTGVTFQVGSTTYGGARGGTNSTTLTATQIPSITSANAVQPILVTGPNGHTVSSDQTPSSNSSPGGGNLYFTGGALSNSLQFSGNNAINVTSNNTGGQAFPSVPSCLLGTLLWKL